MWNRATRYRVVFLLFVFVTYIGSLVYNLTERERRSLRLQEEVRDSDQVHISVRIVEANPTASEITARLAFRLSGKIAQDGVTPAVDVTVILNTVRGPQFYAFPRGRRINPIYAFPRGRRINPIFAIFSLDGNVNRYPVDRHYVDIWILITVPNTGPKAPLGLSDEIRQPTFSAPGNLE